MRGFIEREITSFGILAMAAFSGDLASHKTKPSLNLGARLGSGAKRLAFLGCYCHAWHQMDLVGLAGMLAEYQAVDQRRQTYTSAACRPVIVMQCHR